MKDERRGKEGKREETKRQRKAKERKVSIWMIPFESALSHSVSISTLVFEPVADL